MTARRVPSGGGPSRSASSPTVSGWPVSSRLLRAVVVALVVVGGGTWPRASAPPAGAAPSSGTYLLPVDAPVVDPYRPPSTPYGSGNRGWQLGTRGGEIVRAAADGTVTFAGTVASGRYVTIEHAGGLRTTVSWLTRVLVTAGGSVRQGDAIGVASDHLHLSVRDASGTYLDPALLFGPLRTAGARLVPDHEAESAAGGSASSGSASSGGGPAPLRPGVGGPGSASAPAGGGPPPSLSPSVAPPPPTPPPTPEARAIAASAAWRGPDGPCSGPSVPTPQPAPGRILVLVGGLGSTSTNAGVDGVDATALGYRTADVVRFSYAGGRVPDPGDAPDLGSVPSSAYAATDTEQSIAVSAERLARLLTEIARARPGVPIDLVGHSLGGVVATAAAAHGTPEAPIATLVTIGSPHGGAPLAEVAGSRTAGPGSALRGALLTEALAVLGADLDPRRPVYADLRALAARPIGDARPPSWSGPGRPGHVLTVAGAGDLVVPGPRAVLPGADAQVVVPIHGVSAHDRLPADPATTRAVAFAVAGRPPPCASAGTVASAALTGLAIERAELAAR